MTTPSTTPAERAKEELQRGLPERAALIDELVTARLLSARVEQRESDQVEMIDIIHETCSAGGSGRGRRRGTA